MANPELEQQEASVGVIHQNPEATLDVAPPCEEEGKVLETVTALDEEERETDGVAGPVPAMVTPIKEELLGGRGKGEQGQELLWIDAEAKEPSKPTFGRNLQRRLQWKNSLGKVVFLNQESETERQRALLKTQEARDVLDEAFDINSPELMKAAFAKAIDVRALCEPDADMEYLYKLRLKGNAAGHEAIQISEEMVDSQLYADKQDGKIRTMGVVHPTRFNPKAGLLTDKAKAYLEKILPEIPECPQEKLGFNTFPDAFKDETARAVSPTSPIFRDHEVDFVQTKSPIQRSEDQKKSPARDITASKKSKKKGLSSIFRRRESEKLENGDDEVSDEGIINLGPLFSKPRTHHYDFLAVEAQEEILPPARPDDSHVAADFDRTASLRLEEALPDDCSLSSFDGRGHIPNSSPISSPSGPIMVTVPKVNPTLMRQESWDSLLEGISLEEVIRDHHKEDETELQPANSLGTKKKGLFSFRQKD